MYRRSGFGGPSLDFSYPRSPNFGGPLFHFVYPRFGFGGPENICQNHVFGNDPFANPLDFLNVSSGYLPSSPGLQRNLEGNRPKVWRKLPDVRAEKSG